MELELDENVKGMVDPLPDDEPGPDIAVLAAIAVCAPLADEPLLLVARLPQAAPTQTVVDVVTVQVDVVTPPSARVSVLVASEVPVLTYVVVDETALAVADPELPHAIRHPARSIGDKEATRFWTERVPCFIIFLE